MATEAETLISHGKAELNAVVRRLVKVGMNREALLGLVRAAMDEQQDEA